MSTTQALWKLIQIWRPLCLPQDGPDWGSLSPPGKKKENTRDGVGNRVNRHKAIYEEPTRKWAHALYRHCSSEAYGPDRHRNQEEDPGAEARNWINQCLQKHIEDKTDDRSVPFPVLKLSVRKILEGLVDFKPVEDEGKIGRSASGKKKTASEEFWFQILGDDVKVEEFNFIFRFSSEVLQMTNSAESFGGADRKGLYTDAHWLNAISEAWHHPLKINRALADNWVGKYLLFRADARLYYEPEDASSRIKSEQKTGSKYGWFGRQKVLVVPVALEAKDDALMWEDLFPNPKGDAFESRGALTANRDTTIEVFGVDKQIETTGKFIGVLERPNRRGHARGVMFGRDTTGTQVEAYRFWLCVAEKPIFGDLSYEKVYKHIQELVEQFKSPAPSKKHRETLENDNIVIRPVEAFLEEGGQEMVHYLFMPSGTIYDDLYDSKKVMKITHLDVNAGMLKASFGSRR